MSTSFPLQYWLFSHILFGLDYCNVITSKTTFILQLYFTVPQFHNDDGDHDDQVNYTARGEGKSSGMKEKIWLLFHCNVIIFVNNVE